MAQPLQPLAVTAAEGVLCLVARPSGLPRGAWLAVFGRRPRHSFAVRWHRPWGAAVADGAGWAPWVALPGRCLHCARSSTYPPRGHCLRCRPRGCWLGGRLIRLLAMAWVAAAAATEGWAHGCRLGALAWALLWVVVGVECWRRLLTVWAPTRPWASRVRAGGRRPAAYCAFMWGVVGGKLTMEMTTPWEEVMSNQLVAGWLLLVRPLPLLRQLAALGTPGVAWWAHLAAVVGACAS